jgi:hypothetical protein
MSLFQSLLQIIYIVFILYCCLTFNQSDLSNTYKLLTALNETKTETNYYVPPSFIAATQAVALSSETLITKENSEIDIIVNIKSIIVENLNKVSSILRTIKSRIQEFFFTIVHQFIASPRAPSVAQIDSKDTSTATSNTVNTDNLSKESLSMKNGVVKQSKITEWAGKPITKKEEEQIQIIRNELHLNNNEQQQQQSSSLLQSQWSRSIHDSEILRFLRMKNHHIAQTITALKQHDQWRLSLYGAEGEFTQHAFPSSNDDSQVCPLRYEIFWLGPDVHNEHCPTLVIRTQVHDGLYYNDDPKIYTR